MTVHGPLGWLQELTSSNRRTTVEASFMDAPVVAPEVVEEQIPLVRHIAFQVATRFPRHVDREELVRAGMLGLVEASRRYDEARGVPFSRFAAQRIRGAVLDAARSNDWAPRSVRAAARKIEAAEQHLIRTLGRAPEPAEIAERLGMTLAALSSLQDQLRRALLLALDHRVSDGEEELTLGDLLTDRTESQPDERLEQRELHAYLRDAVALLPARHRTVVWGYFFGGRSSVSLAEELGVTESRISQLRSEAMEMLKEALDGQYTNEEPEPPTGCAARRRAAYIDAVANRSTWRERLSVAS